MGLKEKMKRASMEQELAKGTTTEIAAFKEFMNKDEARLTLRIQKEKLEDFKYVCKVVYKSDMSKEIMRYIDSVLANNQTAVASRRK